MGRNGNQQSVINTQFQQRARLMPVWHVCMRCCAKDSRRNSGFGSIPTIENQLTHWPVVAVCAIGCHRHHNQRPVAQPPDGRGAGHTRRERACNPGNVFEIAGVGGSQPGVAERLLAGQHTVESRSNNQYLMVRHVCCTGCSYSFENFRFSPFNCALFRSPIRLVTVYSIVKGVLGRHSSTHLHRSTALMSPI
jgi:hypothetical protein